MITAQTHAPNVLARLAALALVAVLSACATSYEFDVGQIDAPATIDTIAILPPDVSVVYQVLDGDHQRLVPQEQRLRELLVEHITQALHRQGYSVRDLAQLPSWKRDVELRFAYEILKQSHQMALQDLRDTGTIAPGVAVPVPIGVGALANPFARASQANALLIVRYSGFQKSEALAAKQLLSNALLGAVTGSVQVPQRQGGRLELSLLDAASGEILWTDSNEGEASAVDLTTSLLRKLPPPSPVTPGAHESTD